MWKKTSKKCSEIHRISVPKIIQPVGWENDLCVEDLLLWTANYFWLRSQLYAKYQVNSFQNFQINSLYSSKKKKCQKRIQFLTFDSGVSCWNGILLPKLLPKLFWPNVRKNCSSDWEKLLKFEAEYREFTKFLRSLDQFIQIVKGQNNFW